MFTQKKKEYYSKILGFKTIQDFEEFAKRYLKYLENQPLTKNRIMCGFFILVEIQKEALKNKTHLFTAKNVDLLLLKLKDIFTVYSDRAARCLIKTTHNMHKGTFTTPRFTQDRNTHAIRYRKRHVSQRIETVFLFAIDFANTGYLNHLRYASHSGSSIRVLRWLVYVALIVPETSRSAIATPKIIRYQIKSEKLCFDTNFSSHAILM